MRGKVPGLGTPDCSDSHLGSTCTGRVETSLRTSMGSRVWETGGNLARLRAKGAAAMDPRRRELRAVGERAGRCAFCGGGAMLIPSRESGMFGCKGVMKTKRLLHL